MRSQGYLTLAVYQVMHQISVERDLQCLADVVKMDNSVEWRHTNTYPPGSDISGNSRFQSLRLGTTMVDWVCGLISFNNWSETTQKVRVRCKPSDLVDEAPALAHVDMS